MNFGGLDPSCSQWDEAVFVVVPVPYDLTSTYQSGSRRGPMAVIQASANMELYDEELSQETCLAGIHTLDPIEVMAGGPREMMDSIRQVVGKVCDAGKIPVIIGGEHSVTYGAVQAVKEKYPRLGALQFDAHADLRDAYQGTPYSHASIGRRLTEMCPLVQLGVRSMSREEADFIRQERVVSFSPARMRGGGDWEDKMLEALPRDLYVSIDIDVLDPAYMPATGTPEPDGLSWAEITAILKKIVEVKQVRAFDLVELAPVPGLVAPDFLAAKLIYRFMGYLARGFGSFPGKGSGAALE